MSVDFQDCPICGEWFCDAGPYFSCEVCGNSICDGCAREKGCGSYYEDDDDSD